MIKGGVSWIRAVQRVNRTRGRTISNHYSHNTNENSEAEFILTSVLDNFISSIDIVCITLEWRHIVIVYVASI
jgi:hypothetical protein